ncbi:hypothetical protein TPY_2356 [Sulfobacillus acidophilus TPY]|nr:hypothetical protein TPY_2356 [Sulfobacillus acidophilus TPY]
MYYPRLATVRQDQRVNSRGWPYNGRQNAAWYPYHGNGGKTPG